MRPAGVVRARRDIGGDAPASWANCSWSPSPAASNAVAIACWRASPQISSPSSTPPERQSAWWRTNNSSALEVLAMRRAFQNTMRDELVEAVEPLTGRAVEAFLSDTLHEPDVAVEIFLS
jgi:hypothetical protein